MRTFYRLARFYMAMPGRLGLALVCTALAVALGLAVPLILKEVLDYGLAQRRMSFLYMAGGLLLAVTTVRGIVGYGQGYLTAFLAQHLAYRLRNLMYEQIQRLSFAYHDQAQTGELMARATSDIEAIRLFFHFGWPTGLNVCLSGAGTILAMAWLDWRLAALACASVPFFLGVVVGLARMLRPLKGRVQAHNGALTVTLQESLAGIRVIKAFARERQQIQTFVTAAEALCQAHLAVAQKEALNFPLLTLCLALVLALTLYLGGSQVISGQMSLGTLVAATGYLAQLAQPLRRLSWLTGMVSLCQAGGERLFAILDTAPTVHEAPQPCALPQLQGHVCFDHVGFAYSTTMPVLHDLTFTAQPGQVIALLGSTGSGKSTIAQLIPRFYDVTSGRITLDGFDLRAVPLQALRQQIGIVMQEAFLFATTIRDNIAYGREDLDLPTIVAAAQAARAHEFIVRFPDGYETWVGERGVTLSEGQRQRLAIARVFARDPRVLILDDATSSVDMETEFLIQQALAALMAGRTTFVIAQRLRTLKQADCILVLDQGRIVQRGTHAELIVQPGLYQRIYDVQLRDQEDFLLAVPPEGLQLAAAAPDHGPRP